MGKDKSRESRHLVIVDVMKGICILMVIMTHVDGITFPMRKKMLYPFTVLPAVSLFILLSTYVFALAEERWRQRNGGYWDIQTWFRKDRFYPRLRRFLLPYALVCVLTAAGMCAAQGGKISPLEVWEIIVTGGRGPGAYYVILMLEFLALFPFLKYWFDTRPFEAAVGMVLLDLAFGTMSRYVWDLSETVYDRMLFRFLGHILLGFVLAKYQDRIIHTPIPFLSVLVGVIYRINTYYFHYEQVLQPNRFVASSLLASLFSFGVLCYAFRGAEWAERHSGLLSPLCFLGKASYHILLAQMLYFALARKYGLEESLGSLPRMILVDYTVSLAAGSLFYLIMNGAEKLAGKTFPGYRSGS